MSITATTASGAGGPSQMLGILLSRLDQVSPSSAAASDDTASTTGATAANTLTGTSKPSLSSMILRTLMALQQQPSAGAAQNSQPASDPLKSLFSAMDSDGGGTVSKSEMESYIQQQGGTSAEADTLYSSLGGSDSQEISSADLAANMPKPPGPPPGGAWDGAAGQPDGAANGILSMLDTDNDGVVSHSEFEGFVTSNGGTAQEADSDFAALDSSNSGSLGSSDFSKALDALNGKANDGSYSPLLTLLDTFAQNANAGSTQSLTA